MQNERDWRKSKGSWDFVAKVSKCKVSSGIILVTGVTELNPVIPAANFSHLALFILSSR